MRNYGRFLKNIAGILLLLALVSLLLPFCRFPVGGQEITLSGMDVLSAGAKAGYTYLTKGQLADDYVLKAPLTVGTMKSALTFVQGNVDSRLLAAGAVAVVLPLLLCFLAMCMLFLARGKKTMVLPTLFTLIVLAEMLVALFGLAELHPYLRIGVYLFTLLHGIALILILIGWVTGGYRRPEEKSKDSNSHERTPRKSHHRWSRRKLFRKKKSKKKRKSKKQPARKESTDKRPRTGKENTDKRPQTGKDNTDKKPQTKKDNTDKKSPSRKETTAQKNGTAKNDSSAAGKNRSSKKKGSRDMVADRGSSYVWNDCSISYDTTSKTYQIVNNSLEDILIYKDDTVIGGLKSGGKVFVDDTVTLQRKGSQERLRLSGKSR